MHAAYLIPCTSLSRSNFSGALKEYARRWLSSGANFSCHGSSQSGSGVQIGHNGLASRQRGSCEGRLPCCHSGARRGKSRSVIVTVIVIAIIDMIAWTRGFYIFFLFSKKSD